VSAGISIKILGKGVEWYVGKSTKDWTIAQISITILTIGIEISIKV